MISVEQVLDHLIAHRASALPLKALADVFDRLIWITDDNGAEILRLRDQWLAGDDPVRAEIALRMNEVYPAESETGFDALAAKVGSRWPDLVWLVEQSREAWRAQRASA